MNLIPNQSDSDMLVISLGTEEALILMQPGEMLRAVLDAVPAWSAKARFLTNPDRGAGMLAVLPRLVGRALLAVPARHPAERELKELLFDQLAEDEYPRLSVAQP